MGAKMVENTDTVHYKAMIYHHQNKLKTMENCQTNLDYYIRSKKINAKWRQSGCEHKSSF